MRRSQFSKILNQPRRSREGYGDTITALDARYNLGNEARQLARLALAKALDARGLLASSG
jgi:hypothetical protein